MRHVYMPFIFPFGSAGTQRVFLAVLSDAEHYNGQFQVMPSTKLGAVQAVQGYLLRRDTNQLAYVL